MHSGVSGVTRNAFLGALRRAGTRVTSSQLQRWIHAGWVSKPQIKGRGRGRGVDATYSPTAFFEAYFLARWLQHGAARLDEAGWYVWVLGFGDAERVRRFLLSELEAQEEIGRALVGRGRRRRVAERAIQTAGRSRAFAKLRTVLGEQDTVRAIRVITTLRAGLPSPDLRQLSAVERDDWRDALAQEGWRRVRENLSHLPLPDSLPEHDLPSPEDMPRLLAAELDPTAVVAALQTWPAPWIRGLCDEAQYVLEEFLGRFELLTPEGLFNHIRNQLDPERRAGLEALRHARGWVTPPLAPFWRRPEFGSRLTLPSTGPGETNAPAH